METLPFGTYQHYKGGMYEVINVALHTETGEKMVLYKALYETPDLTDEYGEEPLFVRPYEMFVGTLEVDGQQVQRFQKADD